MSCAGRCGTAGHDGGCSRRHRQVDNQAANEQAEQLRQEVARLQSRTRRPATGGGRDADDGLSAAAPVAQPNVAEPASGTAVTPPPSLAANPPLSVPPPVAVPERREAGAGGGGAGRNSEAGSGRDRLPPRWWCRRRCRRRRPCPQPGTAPTGRGRHAVGSRPVASVGGRGLRRRSRKRPRRPPEPRPRAAPSPLLPRLGAAQQALANGQIEDARRLLQQAQLQLVFGPGRGTW